jgi:hypothetical protein
MSSIRRRSVHVDRPIHGSRSLASLKVLSPLFLPLFLEACCGVAPEDGEPSRAATESADSPSTANDRWQSLFNGRDLAGWEKWLGPRKSGYLDPASEAEPALGLDNDPLEVFTVVEKDGAPAIRISGEIFGAITTKESFDNSHILVEYKWGEKKWPPRAEPQHHRDSGILYRCIGPHGAGSYAWKRSVECNIMERGVGQWWSVAGTIVDIEGRKIVLTDDPTVPYQGEGPGEQCIVYERGGPQFTTGEGITSRLDPEKAGEWNVCEVIAWGNVGLHLLEGQVVLALVNPRYREGDREIPLVSGTMQLQSEGAELFVRRVEVRPIDGIPPELFEHVPRSAPDESGFVPLIGEDSAPEWKQCGPGSFAVSAGVATPTGGMGLWWYSKRPFENFVLRGEFLQESTTADSGIYVRFPDPGDDPWNAVKTGHEIEIGDPEPENPAWRTGSLYPFRASSKANTRTAGEWNEYEIVCTGHDYSVRINGEIVTTWSDPGKRSARGYIGIQNYDDGSKVRHRNLRIKDLP